MSNIYRYLTNIGSYRYFWLGICILYLKGSKNQALYHEILLLQKFNDILGKVLKPKKNQPSSSEKITQKITTSKKKLSDPKKKRE